MILDHRTYTLFPQALPEFYKIYEAEGFPVQSKILGRLIGFFHTEFGPLNQIVHMWAYDSFEERTRRRTELFQNPQWLSYMTKVRPLISHMENKLLLPAPFSPLK